MHILPTHHSAMHSYRPYIFLPISSSEIQLPICHHQSDYELHVLKRRVWSYFQEITAYIALPLFQEIVPGCSGPPSPAWSDVGLWSPVSERRHYCLLLAVCYL